MPRAGRARPRGPIRIWSVPCATGEEPLTIAMLLDEAGWFDRAPIEIHAGDASAAALARARAGRYRERAFRTLPPALRETLLSAADGDAWRVDPALHARVSSLERVNLMDEPTIAAVARSADVVFCRNVFIYFSDAGVRRVVDDVRATRCRRPAICASARPSRCCA